MPNGGARSMLTGNELDFYDSPLGRFTVYRGALLDDLRAVGEALMRELNVGAEIEEIHSSLSNAELFILDFEKLIINLSGFRY
jgi:hypothetical protein